MAHLRFLVNPKLTNLTYEKNLITLESNIMPKSNYCNFADVYQFSKNLVLLIWNKSNTIYRINDH